MAYSKHRPVPLLELLELGVCEILPVTWGWTVDSPYLLITFKHAHDRKSTIDELPIPNV